MTTTDVDVSSAVVVSSGLSQRAILILTSLAGGAKHGYALLKDIEQFAGVILGPGTLYGVLARLEDGGLVEALPAQERRHPYQITSRGKELLSAQLRRDERIAAVGLARVGAQPT